MKLQSAVTGRLRFLYTLGKKVVPRFLRLA